MRSQRRCVRVVDRRALYRRGFRRGAHARAAMCRRFTRAASNLLTANVPLMAANESARARKALEDVDCVDHRRKNRAAHRRAVCACAGAARAQLCEGAARYRRGDRHFQLERRRQVGEELLGAGAPGTCERKGAAGSRGISSARRQAARKILVAAPQRARRRSHRAAPAPDRPRPARRRPAPPAAPARTCRCGWGRRTRRSPHSARTRSSPVLGPRNFASG